MAKAVVLHGHTADGKTLPIKVDSSGRPIRSGLSGAFSEYAEKVQTEQTTNETPQDYLSLAITTTEANELRDILISYRWSGDSVSYDCIQEVHLDDVLISELYKSQTEPKNAGANQRINGMFSGRITIATAGAHTLKLKHASSSSANIASIIHSASIGAS